MQEGDEPARRAFQGLFIDQAYAGTGGLRQLAVILSVRNAMWWRPSPRSARNLAIGLWGEVGSSSSKWTPPTSKNAVRTFCEAISSRCPHCKPKRFFINGYGLVKRVNRDAKMIDLLKSFLMGMARGNAV